jgi:hypothetical protein
MQVAASIHEFHRAQEVFQLPFSRKIAAHRARCLLDFGQIKSAEFDDVLYHRYELDQIVDDSREAENLHKGFRQNEDATYKKAHEVASRIWSANLIQTFRLDSDSVR